jgi:hypothetical protein
VAGRGWVTELSEHPAGEINFNKLISHSIVITQAASHVSADFAKLSSLKNRPQIDPKSTPNSPPNRQGIDLAAIAFPHFNHPKVKEFACDVINLLRTSKSGLLVGKLALRAVPPFARRRPASFDPEALRAGAHIGAAPGRRRRRRGGAAPAAFADESVRRRTDNGN